MCHTNHQLAGVAEKRGVTRRADRFGQRWLRCAGLLLAVLGISANAQVLFDQTAVLYSTNYNRGVNYRSGRGVPLSAVAGNPVGSDGRGFVTQTPNQFKGMVVYGAVARPSKTTFTAGLPLAANATNLGLSRATNSGGAVLVILRSAQVGGPYVSHAVSYLYGSTLIPPVTDEGGLPATADYWRTEPYTTNGHATAGYYWSPHAGVAFATQPGPLSVTWIKQVPQATQPSGRAGVNFVNIGGLYYTLTNSAYVISGVPIKTPRKMFWTEGVFRGTGKPVSVPTARVGAIVVAYNNAFPSAVTSEYLAPGQTLITAQTNTLQELRTLWFDQRQGQIFAYNAEGRAFMELLGDATGGQTRQHLGYEIVDVTQQPIPTELVAELGEKITAYGDGTSDEALNPEPLSAATSGAQPFLYLNTVPGDSRPDYYAVRETANLNDTLVYWTEAGVANLRWPLIFGRYKIIWPTDAAKYSHYVRPLVSTKQAASATAVPLPNDNVPAIQFQDALDFPRAALTETFAYYTFLDAAHPVHRGLLRFTVGDRVAFERVFSWLDVNLKATNFAGTLATNLMPVGDFMAAPRVITQLVYVGDRIVPPTDEAGINLAGYIHQPNGNSFNPTAYINPFASGFEAAQNGAIIPVNAIPGTNSLDVWWFRVASSNAATSGVRIPENGFKPIYWPAVIGRYTLDWPPAPSEIVLASNDGSGALPSLQAKGSIYVQNNPALPGYNPNEEHALMLGGQAYALRDDLNLTGTNVPAVLGANASYSSQPFVLLDYFESDGRPAMRAFRVLREKPSAGIVFDYVVQAGANQSDKSGAKPLQAPMPLPFLAPPVELVTNTIPFLSGSYQVILHTNYNREQLAPTGDLPANSTALTDPQYAAYQGFTYRDRKEQFWVMRGVHAGPPALNAGQYTGLPDASAVSFSRTLPAATAVVDTPFTNTFHVSRPAGSLVLTLATGSPTLPNGLQINGLTLTGTPTEQSSPTNYSFVITDSGDGASVTVTLPLTVVASGIVVAQGPLVITSPNPYAGGTNATYVGRPPFLAVSPQPVNSFTMRFYYKTQAGFAWPGDTTPPPVGSIVPYLRPVGSTDDPGAKTTAALDIVYRPVWPGDPLQIQFGETLMAAGNNRPAVRGQTSVQVLYQQSIATNTTTARPSVVLHDPTREKLYQLQTDSSLGLAKLPDGVKTENYQGKTYFPNLPPHLAKRFFFDPNRGAAGALVFRGEYQEQGFSKHDWVLLNVLRGSDLTVVKSLCPPIPADQKSAWDAAIDGLATTVETFYENPSVPGQFIVNTNATVTVGVGDLAEIKDSDTAVDSYALSASGPGQGYITFVVGDGAAFTPVGNPISVYVMRVTGRLFPGELKIIPNDNPLSELVSFQHNADLAGRFDDYEYEWKINPPVDGTFPALDSSMSFYQALTNGTGVNRYTLGGSGIQGLVDNYVVMRYRPANRNHPLYRQWSDWTEPQLVEGWIKRVLAKINPFNQRVTDLYNNSVNTDASILTSAGKRWEGDIALNMDTINNYGLIEIYETILRRGRGLSIDAGVNFGPANDALLLAAGYLNDLYMLVGNEAYADAANPTIGIGTKDNTYGNIATALFAFKGQVPSLLEEELVLLRGRDDFLQPGVRTGPVYNRFVWNYTRGIDAGEVVYALNYNILDRNNDGKVDAADAAVMYPQGHGDAYGHYLTAVKGYYSLLLNNKFDWVPRIEAVTILGKAVAVDYLDERKFAAAAAAVARTGRQVFDLTWRKDYQAQPKGGWEYLGATRTNSARTEVISGSRTNGIVREWGADQWASRTGQGSFLNWVVGNAILPDVDPDPSHEGIQKIDRTTVPELAELVTAGSDLQTAMDNAEGRLTPLGLAPGSLAFDVNPNTVTGANPQTHFEQVYSRALVALNNAMASFDDAKDVTRLMRSEEDSLADFVAGVAKQELAYTNALIEIYGTPYTDDIGPGKTYRQGYEGPDLIHYGYVTDPESTFGGNANQMNYTNQTFRIDTQQFPIDWSSADEDIFDRVVHADDSNYKQYFEFNLASAYGGQLILRKPDTWTGVRQSPGKLQQAFSEYILAHNELRQALANAEGAKSSFDDALNLFDKQSETYRSIRSIQRDEFILDTTLRSAQYANDLFEQAQDLFKDNLERQQDAAKEALPLMLIAGFASGGDLTSAGRAAIKEIGAGAIGVVDGVKIAAKFLISALQFSTDTAKAKLDFYNIPQIERNQEVMDALNGLAGQFADLSSHFDSINAKSRALDDKLRALRTMVAQGNRLQAERQVFRQRTAAVIQGYRTRDAAFRIFRNEKLERYKSLFDLASRFGYLAANAYDYETGLLGTDVGRSFVSRIINSRALGVVKNGEPQFAGSNVGDPGLSSVLAEMKADWDVLKGRLGFNNPDAYGTTASLRTGKLRILPTTDGDATWQDVLNGARVDNLLDDVDVRRYCLQIDPGNGLPVPGIVLTFSTTIAPGYNLFGQQLAAGDASLDVSSFATKIFGVGVALEGYRGMQDPVANGSLVNSLGGTSPADPNLSYLDPLALSGYPYVYLIPVGVDSMRSPPLGDTSDVRTWSVADVAIPLPFNIGGSSFSTADLYQSSSSLSEPLFTLRKHQAFRPVSTATAFSSSLYTASGSLQRSQFTNNRLIGRSAWNSQWKLVIPGNRLLNDPKEGLDRFIQTVKDVKLHFITYSYSGN